MFTLVTPLYMQLIVDEVLVKHDVDLLIVLAAGFLGLAVITLVTRRLQKQLDFSSLRHYPFRWRVVCIVVSYTLRPLSFSRAIWETLCRDFSLSLQYRTS